MVAPPPAKTCADLDDDGDGVNNCDDKCPGSQAGQTIGPDGCPVPVSIDLKGVNFDFDKSTIRPDAAATLDSKIPWLTANPGMRIRIEGNADERGSDEYNLALGQRRAASAKRYLVEHGIDAGRFDLVSYGEERPVCTEHDESCWQRNRRDDFVIVTIGADNIVAPPPGNQ